MQVSAFPAIFKANFGHFQHVSAVFRHVSAGGRYARFWPNQLGSARIEADLARIEPSRRESEKKNKNAIL